MRYVLQKKRAMESWNQESGFLPLSGLSNSPPAPLWTFALTSHRQEVVKVCSPEVGRRTDTPCRRTEGRTDGSVRTLLGGVRKDGPPCGVKGFHGRCAFRYTSWLLLCGVYV